MSRIGWLAVLAAALATGPASAQFGGFGPGGMGGGGVPEERRRVTVEIEADGGKRVSGPIVMGNIAIQGDFGLYQIKPEKIRMIRLDPGGDRTAIITGGMGGVPIAGTVVTTSGEEISGVLLVPSDWTVATDLGWVTLDPNKLRSITVLDEPGEEGPSKPAGATPAGGDAGGRAGTPRIMRLGSILWAASPSGHRIAIKVDGESEAATLELPASEEAPLDVTPVTGSRLVALQLDGEEVRRVAVFSFGDRAWHAQDLREPAEGRVSPMVSSAHDNAMVAYHLGRFVYAFSTRANRWDILELPEGVSAQPIMQTNSIVVQHDGRIHTFKAGDGTWSHTDARDLLGDALEDDREEGDGAPR